jgi:hypothetical protein
MCATSCLIRERISRGVGAMFRAVTPPASEYLRNARRLVRTLDPKTLLPWPLPSYPPLVTRCGTRFLGAIGLTQTKARLNCYKAQWALDEWLQSDDLTFLSPMQRAICGCAVLEVYSFLPSLDRVSPSILHGLTHLSKVLDHLTPEGLRAVKDAIDTLMASSKRVSLSTAEIALLRLFAVVLDALRGTGSHVDTKSIRMWRREAFIDEHERNRRMLRRLELKAAKCDRLPRQLRNAFGSAVIRR